MITAETVNGIVRFQANGLLAQIRPLAKDRALDHRYRACTRR